jgi:hypothetical protein
MFRIESCSVRVVTNWPVPYIRNKAGSWLCDVSFGTNRRANSAVGHAQERSSVFNSSKDCVRQMLSHHCRPTKISIVRNVYKKVGAFIRQVLSDGWISGLNTNEYSSAMISNRHQRVLIACGEVSYESRYQRTSQPVWERNIFAERQQPNLIILSDLSTVFIYQHCGVKSAIVWCRFEWIQQQRSVVLLCKLLDDLLKLGVRTVCEVHGWLWPHNKTR